MKKTKKTKCHDLKIIIVSIILVVNAFQVLGLSPTSQTVSYDGNEDGFFTTSDFLFGGNVNVFFDPPNGTPDWINGYTINIVDPGGNWVYAEITIDVKPNPNKESRSTIVVVHYNNNPNDTSYATLIQEGIPPGNNCNNPIVIDFDTDLPFLTSDSTCGRGNDYDNSCMDVFDDDEDIHYELIVSEPMWIKVNFETPNNAQAGIAIKDECGDAGGCLIFDATIPWEPAIFLCQFTVEGTYYLMIDSHYNEGCILDYSLEILEWDPQGSDCSNPVPIDFGTDLPYYTNNTTCLRGNNYENTSCISVWDDAEDIQYEFIVPSPMWIEVGFDPAENFSSIALKDQCGNEGVCMYWYNLFIEDDYHSFQFEFAEGGTYYLSIDNFGFFGQNCLTEFTLDIKQPFIKIQPDFQSIPHQAGATDPFNITNNLATDWKIGSTLPGWVSVTDSSHIDDYIIFEVTENIGDTYRDTIVIIHDENNSDIADTLTIFQGASSQTFIMVSPEVESIGYEGGETDPFHIIHFNIASWERGSTLPDWITEKPSRTVDSVIFIVEENSGDTFRDTIIIFQEFENPDVADTVTIYQAAVEPFIAISPEIQSIGSSGGETDTFNIIPYNIEGWEVADSANLPFGITVGIQDSINNVLTFSVLQNESADVQVANITVQEVSNPEVSNELTIYQGSLSEPSILVTPETQTIDHPGGSTDTFHIIRFNIDDWEVANEENLPFGITIEHEDQFNDFVIFNVPPNESGSLQEANIIVQEVDNPEVNDELKIFQGAQSEPSILVSPEIQTFSFESVPETNPFYIYYFNIDGWTEVIDEEDQNWVETNSKEENEEPNYITFTLEENTWSTLRETAIEIHDENDEVIESLTIYQGTKSEPSILVTPEIQSFSFESVPETSPFYIYHFNIDGWTTVIDPDDQEWIFEKNKEDIEEPNYITFELTENTGETIREATIEIHDNDEEVVEMLKVYQGTQSEPSIIVTPEVQSYSFEAKAETDKFNVINFNVGSWKAVIDEDDQDWVSEKNKVVDEVPNYITFTLTENTNDNLRIATIIIHDQEDNPDVYDTLRIIQKPAKVKRLIATPDEFYVSHEGKSNLNSSITEINVSGWVVAEINKPEWIIVTSDEGGPILTFEVKANPNYNFRLDSLKLYAFSAPEVVEYIKVRQGGKGEPYFIVQPNEQYKSHKPGKLKYPFIVDTFNFNQIGWFYTDLADSSWIKVNREGDSLIVEITEVNEEPDERYAVIRVKSEHEDPVTDSVVVTQFTDEYPYIFVIPGSYSAIPATGDKFEIEINSNETWVIEKKDEHDWYSVNPVSGENDGVCEITVLENFDTTDYYAKNSWIIFKSENVADTFDLAQLPPDLSISGKVVDLENSTLIDSVKIVFGTNTVKASLNSGLFTGKVHYGWTGNIEPVSDRYFFVPKFYEIVEPLHHNKPYIEDDTNSIRFQAIEIDPKIRFSDTLVNNCFNNKTLSSEDIGNPFVTIEGYSGATEYKWTSNPVYDSAIIGYTDKEPVFSIKYAPVELTEVIFKLTINNLDPVVSDSFKMKINPSPEARPIESNWWVVCKNQAGVIYLADTATPLSTGEYFTWSIDPDTVGTFDTLSNTNIAIINWGKNDGKYLLNLKTHNEFGCTANYTKVVTISDSESPLPLDVHWKQPDNVLYFNEIDIRSDSCQWGCIEMITKIEIGDKEIDTIIVLETIFSGKNDWYCRLPDGYEFNTKKYNYFVIRYSDPPDCWTRSFYNPPLDVVEFNEGSIKIFPNPTYGLLNIGFQNLIRPQTGNLQLYDISGNLIYQEEIENLKNNATITIKDIWDEQGGIYILRIQTDDYFFTSKIVVR